MTARGAIDQTIMSLLAGASFANVAPRRGRAAGPLTQSNERFVALQRGGWHHERKSVICRRSAGVVAFIGMALSCVVAAVGQERTAPRTIFVPSDAGATEIVGAEPAYREGRTPQSEQLPVPPQIERLPDIDPHESGNRPGIHHAPRNDLGRPRVGVVLGGGGAAGVCHVGVLQVLEEYGIPVDCIAGTSMGSIVAGLYATGLTAQELEQIVYQFRWNEILVEPPAHGTKYERRKTDDYLFPPAITVGIHGGKASLGDGFVSGQNLTQQLRRMLASANAISDFDQLPIPFRTVATDLETGEMVVFRRGNLATAIRASMSIPGVFPPVQYGHRLLIDGGVRNNVPVNLAREMGADIVIVVRIPPDLKCRDELKSLFSVSSQALTIMAAHDNSHQANGLSELDILIEPKMNGIGSLDFGRAKEAVSLGAAAARQVDQQLRDLARLVRAETTPQAIRSCHGHRWTHTTLRRVVPLWRRPNRSWSMTYRSTTRLRSPRTSQSQLGSPSNRVSRLRWISWSETCSELTA